MTETRTYTVVYSFGSVARVSVKFYENDTITTALKRRSDNIVGYIGTDNEYHEIEKHDFSWLV